MKQNYMDYFTNITFFLYSQEKKADNKREHSNELKKTAGSVPSPKKQLPVGLRK